MTFDFHLTQTLQNSEGSIVALAFSKDYRYLGSASKDGQRDGIVRIYNVEVRYQTIWYHRQLSQFETINWDNDCSLIMGTAKGELLTFSPQLRERHGKPDVVHKFSSPIHSIEFNDCGNEMLTCAGDDINVMKKEGDRWIFQRLFHCVISPSASHNLQFLPVVVSSAHFLEDQRHSVITFLHHGLWKINLESGHSQWIVYPDDQIGATAIAPDCTALMVANSTKGLNLYILSSDSWKKKTHTYLERAELPIMSSTHLPVIFIDKGHAAVVGTANGYAVICDSENGGRIQTLRHSSSDSLISGLAYHEENLSIATGDVDGNISIWDLGSPDSKRIRVLGTLVPVAVRYYYSYEDYS
ncbi:WD40-repeat-containing domain protein [Lentinula edodes]|uniref:WD40-repeat-containing domain protein n=1 Tax=Lentinula edodes TaxID=5353 RepID=UPI001E8E044E|nr:WD40-repeat-containing domain protein [Lentinula edodes]KAH7871307.1 WD40-repeat-containing domain protein [Lentinula edodes]